MSKYAGLKFSEDLYNFFKNNRAVGVLGTFSQKGVPHTTPIQWIYPKNREALLMTMNKNHSAYHNLVWQKKVMICFMDNNISYSILCRAGVVRAPSLVHPLMNVIQLDVNEIYEDISALTEFTEGPKYKFHSIAAQEMADELMNELKELSQS